MKRPKLLLINPWIHDFAAYDMWSRPLGLLMLASRLRNEGWEPRLVDCLDVDHPEMKPVNRKPEAHGRFRRTPIPKPEPLKHVPRTYNRYGVDPEFVRADIIEGGEPAAVLVTGIMTYWYPGVIEAIRLVKECFPNVPVLLGGIYATLVTDHARARAGADEVLAGSGEAVISEALHRHTGLKPATAGEGTNPEFRVALDLLRKVRFLPLLTTRGCPFACSYCASRKLWPDFVRRPHGLLAKEIEAAVLRYGISDIALYDDAFLVHPTEHAIPLLKDVADRVPGLRWHSPNGLHASAIGPQVADAMKMAGFQTIRIGLESASDEFHSRTGKKTDRQSFLAAVRNLREAGFQRKQIGTYLLVGLPGQSRMQIEDDVDRVMRAGAMPKLAEYSPIPGTAMWPAALRSSRYPIDEEPLLHNCTLLAAADPEVNWEFLRVTRKRISESVGSLLEK
jgi:radical SAM superfamily enzyme YgiQ (UPF0313 family)